MDLQQNRFDIFNLMNALRFRVEKFYASVLNSACGEMFHGKYDVNLTNPKKVTNRVLNQFCANGSVVFYPDDCSKYEALKVFFEADGGINLSTLLTTKERPDHIPPEEWETCGEMLKQVFISLRNNGIVPMQQLISDSQCSLGYGALKINKNFGGAWDAEEQGAYAITDVMQKMIDSFDAKHTQA